MNDGGGAGRMTDAVASPIVPGGCDSVVVRDALFEGGRSGLLILDDSDFASRPDIPRDSLRSLVGGL